MNGTDLLAEFRKTRSEKAFGELVRTYTNLVYSVANRRLSNMLLAQEASQIVFIRLVKAVPKLRSDAELVAWLHRTTVHVSIDLWRSETRRHAREQHVAAMQPECTEDPVWNEIAPVLDEALDKLDDGERKVILLRFFEQKSMRDLGERFGISEDAAKMRVSRAVDKLRSRLGAKSATCTAAVLGTLLAERSIGAAPAELAVALAAIPAPTLVAAGTGLADLLGQAGRAKLVTALAGALLITGAVVFLVPASKSRWRDASPPDAQAKASDQVADSASANASASNVSDTNQNRPDPRKLLQGVASARRRILSGEMEFTISGYHFDRPLDGTNVVRVRGLFEDNKFRFESFGHEYYYTSMEPNAAEVADARRRAEGLDRAAAEKAGLIKGLDSHHVTTTDGSVFMDYWDASDQPPRTSIYDPDKGWGGRIFDPRTLGITTVLSLHVTADMGLGYATAKSVQLVGKETVDDVACWHVHLQSSDNESLDYWIDAEHPSRVIKHASGRGFGISKYDDGDPKNSLPVEVRIMSFRNGSPQDKQTVIRGGSRYNIAIPAVSWTLAGLEMKVGTGVSDSRIHRSLGYWTGSGLSENLASKSPETNEVPNREELLALLNSDPASAAALDAAHWIILNTPDGPEVEKAADVILRNHIESTNTVLLALVHELDRMRPKSSRPLLEAMIEKNPESAVRGNACFTLATLQKDTADYGSNKVATAEAIKLYERVISEFSQIRRNSGFTLAELAKPELSELRRLIVGEPAPEIEGEDLDGQPLKLSSYRGRVVAVVFWGHCGGCRPDVRALREAQEHFSNRPFAIVGVFTDDHPEDAKAIADELGMTWPSFLEKCDGPIATAFHSREWPSIWLLDQNSVIRQRRVREGLLIRTAEELLGQSQAAR